MIVRIPTARIRDWDTFHQVFAELLGFPAFYGRNMDAWIDCMSSITDPSADMTQVHIDPGGVLALHLDGAAEFAHRCPDQYAALVECAAFVNWQCTDRGYPPLLALSFNR
jgi:hypothetical protein